MSKEKVEENLYYVEKILRIRQGNAGQLQAEVKWVNFSELTWEPVANLLLNPSLSLELKDKVAEFNQRKISRPIMEQIDRDLVLLSQKLFVEDPLPPKQQHGKNPSNLNEKSQESINSLVGVKSLSNKALKQQFSEGKVKKEKSFEGKGSLSQSRSLQENLISQELVMCKVEAAKKMKQRLQYTLGFLSPKDYFALLDIWQLAETQLRQHPSKANNYRATIIEEVLGVYPHHSSVYRFCVDMGQGEIMTASVDWLLNRCPVHLFNFLAKFLRYFRTSMLTEITTLQEQLNRRRTKNQALSAASRGLNLANNIMQRKQGVHFGLDAQDTSLNIKQHNSYFRRLQNNLHSSQSSRQSDHSDRQKSHSLSKKLTKLTAEILAQVKQLKHRHRPDSPQVSSPVSDPRRQPRSRGPQKSRTQNSKRGTKPSRSRSEVVQDQGKNDQVNRSLPLQQSQKQSKGRHKRKSAEQQILSQWQSQESKEESRDESKGQRRRSRRLQLVRGRSSQMSSQSEESHRLEGNRKRFRGNK